MAESRAGKILSGFVRSAIVRRQTSASASALEMSPRSLKVSLPDYGGKTIPFGQATELAGPRQPPVPALRIPAPSERGCCPPHDREPDQPADQRRVERKRRQRLSSFQSFFVGTVSPHALTVGHRLIDWIADYRVSDARGIAACDDDRRAGIILLHHTSLAYSHIVLFVETPVFTGLVRKHLDDDHYRALQIALLLRPEQGALIAGSGGLRKIRWGRKGEGKRGGLRVIYFWHKPSAKCFMLFLYGKNEQGDLTADQTKALSRLVREEFP